MMENKFKLNDKVLVSFEGFEKRLPGIVWSVKPKDGSFIYYVRVNISSTRHEFDWYMEDQLYGA